MATVAIDPTHDCEGGGDVPGGVVAVHEKASSSCCGAVLAEGGNDEAGYTCTGCGQPCEKVMGPPTAHWTCSCGTRRQQVVTQATDHPAEG
jgi:hypothetical protein